MRCGSEGVRCPVILKYGNAGSRGRRELDRPARAESVVEIFVRFVAESSECECGNSAWCQTRCRGIAPKPHFSVGGRNFHGGGAGVVFDVHHEDRSDDGVFRATTIVWWAPTRVAPGSCPYPRRIELEDVFFVADECAIGRVRCVDAVFPPHLPEHVVAAEEPEVDAEIPSCFERAALGGRPIFIMTRREDEAVTLQLVSEAIGIDRCEVADVESVSLEKAQQRILGVEKRVGF